MRFCQVAQTPNMPTMSALNVRFCQVEQTPSSAACPLHWGGPRCCLDLKSGLSLKSHCQRMTVRLHSGPSPGHIQRPEGYHLGRVPAVHPFQFRCRAGVTPGQRERVAIDAGQDGPPSAEVWSADQFQRRAFAHRVAMPVQAQTSALWGRLPHASPFGAASRVRSARAGVTVAV